MSIRKASLQEFQHQIKDVRSQLLEQLKCLEQRTDVQVSILHEINDFLKKRAEIDLEYSKQLDKLVKSVMLKYKNERQKRTNWSLYSTCNLWQQLVDDTKEEAKQRGITAEVYGNQVAASISTRCSSLQKISKKCREIGVLAQGEIIRVLNELQTAMKTYQMCYTEFSAVNAKLQQAETDRNKSQESQSSRKQKTLQKNFNKKCEKFEACRLKCNRARNEYLLCIDAANAALHKFFADDLSDLIDCTDLGMEFWLNLILSNVISARKAACQAEMNSLANLGSFKDSLHPQIDKQKFFESNNSIFMLPKRFEFKFVFIKLNYKNFWKKRCDSSETVNKISLDEGLSEELKQRHHQIRKRLTTLRSESDESWRVLEETDQRIKGILSASTLIEITEHGIADHRPPPESLESELTKAYDFYLQNFSFYLFNANLIMRLEARADGIGNALLSSNVQLRETFSDGDGKGGGQSKDLTEDLSGCDNDWHEQSRRKKRLGSQASAATADSSGGNVNSNVSSNAFSNCQSSPRRRRARLFGGSLEEYVEITGERIPLIVTSCIRVLSQFALHHQGVFRVSGSQVEINHMKEAFENGEDPLRDVQDASDINSIAGVLKLYFRELREPLFPFYLFELLTDCAKCNSTSDFINQIAPLLNKLPRPTYLMLRYLFAFLNHLSEFSDENMMDPYNLAICFGPTLLPIPEGKDQVYYQNYVNEVVKNLIVHHDLIFTAKVSGPRYQKYDIINATATTNFSENNNEIELFVDDTDEYFGSNNGAGVGSVNGNTSVQDGTFNSADFFDYRNYAEELLHNPYRVHNFNMTPKNNQPHYFPGKNLAMNSSTYSAVSAGTGILGMSNYSDCMPPSITASLVKSGANSNSFSGDKVNRNAIVPGNPLFISYDASIPAMLANNGKIENKSNDKEATLRPLCNVVKPTCAVEKDLESFSSHMRSLAKKNCEPINDNETALEQQFQQKVQLMHVKSAPLNQNQPSEPLLRSYTHLISPGRKNITNTSASPELLPESTHQSMYDSALMNRDSSRSSNRSNNSVGQRSNDTAKTLSPATNFIPAREQNATQRPHLNPSVKDGFSNVFHGSSSKESPQYSQIVKSERIRIPVALSDSSTTVVNQKSFPMAQKLNNFVPPSYDTLYGNKNNGCVDNGKKDPLNSPSIGSSTIVSSSSRTGSTGGGICDGSSRSSSSLSTQTPQQPHKETKAVSSQNPIKQSNGETLSKPSSTSSSRTDASSPIRKISQTNNSENSTYSPNQSVQRTEMGSLLPSSSPQINQPPAKLNSPTKRPTALGSSEQQVSVMQK